MVASVQDRLAEIDRLLDGLTRPNPDANGYFWWLFAIGVAGELVADGLTLDARKMRDLERLLGVCCGDGKQNQRA